MHPTVMVGSPPSTPLLCISDVDARDKSRTWSGDSITSDFSYFAFARDWF
jgi:hypothetical protein